ncbi:helicase-like transcription factor CHR28 isoform X2 [Salvia miltiorrhiza]|uniref:helicase-like transcription factor CHR28 isoform X2 n=1 Tax=Salvia miltiorrhiza TaxID=226208 RepID=UPI0025AC8E9E|nr:helicase-like transcription factor CHR28 isoform X2 [Salvia miltiorrhiza]
MSHKVGVPNSNDIFLSKAEIPGSGVLSPSHNSEASDSRTGSSDGISESVGTSSAIVGAGTREPSSQFGIVEHSCSRTVSDSISVQENGLSYSCMVGGPQTPSSYSQNDGGRALSGMSNHSDPLCLYGTSHVTHDGGSSADIDMNHDKDLIGCSRLDFHFENMEDASVIDGDRISLDVSHTESSSCEINTADIPVFIPENGGMHLFGSDDPSYASLSSGFQSLACDGGRMVNTMDEGENYSGDFVSVMPYVDVPGSHFGHHTPECGSGSSVSLNGQVGFSYCSDMSTLQEESKNIPHDSLSCIFSKPGGDIKVKKNVESFTSNKFLSTASEVIDIVRRKYHGGESKLPSKGIKWSSSDSFSSISCEDYVSCKKDVKEGILLKSDFLPRGMVDQTNTQKLAIGACDGNSALLASCQPGMWPLASVKAEMNCQKTENEVSEFNGFYLPNISYQRVQSNMVELINLDDDPDVCILEDMSTPPAASNPVRLNGKLFAASQYSSSTDPVEQMALGHSRLRPNDERVIFRVAVQDLAQPKSEAIPPDGLAVTLLKHQRIALSWMVNKETKGACCSGGILADDQGLGKTVSTIALILKERSPSSKAPIANMGQCQMKMCDVDEDNGAPENYYVEDTRENGGTTNLQTKGRPPAGTLIVCPTSVLRQWSEELHNKVTREADLSVLVYHGSSRIKDPLELAKYDVVITTYAIVSMEVPKQPVVDEKDDQFRSPFKGYSSNKKRKLVETASSKKSARSKKSKKQIDNELFEIISGPLAKVGWYRVVLDEAQTIKNHRTQVARACWGLRAKRRWCLSGTPIQNAIDDLYSYFRFLRHEPYATFKTFCEHIKSPIHRNPRVGYKKLQAVLKTIMLRRTKGTYIDGQPIIDLPPKTIELKRIDFSMEERDFYCRLEANSQAQFAEYAKAGTVKQNYVNILLMLLRLRQACDHPLLVRGFSSTSQMTSSIEMAKNFPLEKNIFLLNCLEGSLAICGICSDPPEDAVVTVCGHVFCNQCICEHMIGDDTQCPNKNCKIRLTSSHIFSSTTLRDAISNNPNPENNHTFKCSDSELAKVSESCSSSYPEGSSKIKAALELLKSLSKPHDPALTLSSLEPNEGCCGSDLLHGCDSVGKNGTPDIKQISQSSGQVAGEKAIVFSQWTRMLDLLEDYLKSSSIQYRRLDGTMPISARDKAVKDFKSLPQVSVMIMSLKAASLGLNMVAACHVILLDLWWNPTTEDQAIDRAHRIGQTRPVSVYRLTVKDTVEDRILALQERKREMVASAFGEDETGGRQTRLTVEDLKYLFRVD